MERFLRFIFTFSIIFIIAEKVSFSQSAESKTPLDKKVEQFLKDKQYSWHGMNVPVADGQTLYDIIVKNKYKSALEIGTSTGHSTIWIAWALSKTGGKLITIEIDKDRYNEALKNFEEAGLSQYIDARLADAHQLVNELKGPFDFVFSDADKSWYINYFKALNPKLQTDGCFVTHNVNTDTNYDFYEYISKFPNYKTTLDTKGAGMAISYKVKITEEKASNEGI